MQNKTTVIIPIHEIDENIIDLTVRAVKSVKEQTDSPENILLYCSYEVSKSKLLETLNEKINEISFGGIISFKSSSKKDKTDFCSMVNQAVENIETEYFSVLEFDDTYKPKFFKNVDEYLIKNEGVSIVLPINNVYDKDYNFISYCNEILWANSFTDNLGYITNELLNVYPYINVNGGVIKTKDFIEIGGLKPSIKIYFWYEFLLRATTNSQNIYVLPKVGYEHMMGRDGSLFEQYKASTTTEEIDFWFKTSKQEQYFTEERDVKYVKK